MHKVQYMDVVGHFEFFPAMKEIENPSGYNKVATMYP